LAVEPKPEVSLAKAEDTSLDFALPPEELEMKHLKKLENMKESPA